MRGLISALLTVIVALVGGQSAPYRWNNVQIVGAGFVDGIVFHPNRKGVCYARTDIGGAYKWSPAHRRWEPILDWVPYKNLNWMGVESIALDPNDPEKLYVACGTYTNPTTPDGVILRSDNRGRTFQATNVPFKFGGNENGRGNGERMAVDPNDGRILLLGTRHDGLWRSTDGAKSWSRVDSFPWPAPSPSGSSGIVVVAFDPATGHRGSPTRTIYAAVSTSEGPSLFRSSNAGTTWQAIEGQPTGLMPTHMVMASDGTIYITYGDSPGPSRMKSGAVWKLDTHSERWTDITPDRPGGDRRFGYAAVSVQRDQPRTLIVSTFFHPGGEQIYRSRDAGESWEPVIGGKDTYDNSGAPYVNRVGIHWLFDIEIDPFNPNHAIFTTGYGGHETFNLTDADRKLPVKWKIMSKGIEESVALSLVSPFEGAPLISGIGDYGGFVHWDLNRPTPAGNFVNPHFSNTDGIAVADAASNIIVRVGRASGFDVRSNIGYSNDFGRTWKPGTAPAAGAMAGSIALSPDGRTWIWAIRGGAYLSRDHAASWTACAGLPAGLRVVADHLDSNRFYALDLFAGKLYRSQDGGVTFAPLDLTLQGGLPTSRQGRGDGRGGQDQLYVTPGRRQDLWIAAFDGLHHSTNDGTSFAKIPSVQELHALGFGKPAPDSTYPALYLVGTVGGVRGIFRSDDAAAHWTRINDDAHQWGLVLQITGDSNRYGRVYVGVHGRGVLYGDPSAN